MTPSQLKLLNELRYKIYDAGIDGGQTTEYWIGEFETKVKEFGLEQEINTTWFNRIQPDVKPVIDLFYAFESATEAFTKALYSVQTDIASNDADALQIRNIVHESVSRAKWWYTASSITAYKDDGNTRTEGTEFSATYIVDLFPEAADYWAGWQLYNDWYHGRITNALIMHCSIQLRDSDLRFRSASVSLDVAPLERKDRTIIRKYHCYNVNPIDLSKVKNTFLQTKLLFDTHLSLKTSIEQKLLFDTVDASLKKFLVS